MAVHPVGPHRRIEARSGEAPVWRFHNSDDWFRGTASIASAQAIQASCQAIATQKMHDSEMVTRYVAGCPSLAPHPKFAIRSFLVRRTRNEQGASRRAQASSVALD